jgi:hypothetical protein
MKPHATRLHGNAWQVGLRTVGVQEVRYFRSDTQPSNQMHKNTDKIYKKPSNAVQLVFLLEQRFWSRQPHKKLGILLQHLSYNHLPFSKLTKRMILKLYISHA